MSEQVEGEVGEQQSGPSPEVLAEAKQLGWVPLEEFRGDKSRWTTAEDFVKRGHEVMPLLKANNARLLGELSTVRQQLAEATSAIEELKTASAEITKERVAAVRRELLAGIRDARAEGNIENEDKLTEKLAELRTAEKASPKPPAAPAIDPEFTAWAADPENAWFGKDKRKTSLAMGIAEELRSDPNNKGLVGRPFYEKVAQEVEATLNPPIRQMDKVEGSRGGSGGSGSGAGGKSYRSLPADAKAVCDRQAKLFVGKPGFKDLAAWQSHYAATYFGDQ